MGRVRFHPTKSLFFRQPVRALCGCLRENGRWYLPFSQPRAGVDWGAVLSAKLRLGIAVLRSLHSLKSKPSENHRNTVKISVDFGSARTILDGVLGDLRRQ